MYFQGFPTIDYDPIGDGNYKTVTDILTRIKIKQSIRDNLALFSKYDIREGETPESVSFKIYENAQYHWIIMMFNKYFDRYYEWPMPVQTLQKYMIDKYSNPNGIHHYETSQSSGNTRKKIIVELADVPGATPVTNYEYEQELNGKRRQISILQRPYIGIFLEDFKNSLFESQP